MNLLEKNNFSKNNIFLFRNDKKRKKENPKISYLYPHYSTIRQFHNHKHMCGRYSFSSSKEKIEKQLGVRVKKALEPNYNIAPTQQAYIVTDKAPDMLQQYRWGLIPYWANDPKVGNNLINARAEGISSKPSFRIPIRRQRCLVLADGFYEWRNEGGEKRPYRITLKEGAVMVFAGLWDIWKGGQGEELHSFAVITTRPNAEMTEVHNRMPVILANRGLQNRWLQEKDLYETMALLQPLEDDMLKIFPVSKMVNSVKVNSPDLYKEVDTPPTLFD